MENKDKVIYTDLDSVIDLFEEGDLSSDELAFPYYKGGVGSDGQKLVSWVHRSELENYLILRKTYNNSLLKRQ
jgi:hypothetical protein